MLDSYRFAKYFNAAQKNSGSGTTFIFTDDTIDRIQKYMAEWNMRMAYGYQYLYGQEEKAIPYAQRWAELDPEDENAPAVIRECKAEIRKRQRSRKKKAKFVPGDTPFEGFDLTNFWSPTAWRTLPSTPTRCW